MTLFDLSILAIVIVCAWLIWAHLEVSRLARIQAAKACTAQGLILLDQTVILKKLRPCKSNHSLFAIERQYIFEFSAIGDSRYQGRLRFIGRRFQGIELDTYRIS